MEKKIEKVLGSWDLKVGSYSYLVVNVERKRRIDRFLMTKLHLFKTSSFIFWEPCMVGAKCSMGVQGVFAKFC